MKFPRDWKVRKRGEKRGRKTGRSFATSFWWRMVGKNETISHSPPRGVARLSHDRLRGGEKDRRRESVSQELREFSLLQQLNVLGGKGGK